MQAQRAVSRRQALMHNHHLPVALLQKARTQRRPSSSSPERRQVCSMLYRPCCASLSAEIKARPKVLICKHGKGCGEGGMSVLLNQ